MASARMEEPGVASLIWVWTSTTPMSLQAPLPGLPTGDQRLQQRRQKNAARRCRWLPHLRKLLVARPEGSQQSPQKMRSATNSKPANARGPRGKYDGRFTAVLSLFPAINDQVNAMAARSHPFPGQYQYHIAGVSLARSVVAQDPDQSFFKR
jgi:hypothetical protein